jgi:hypothetical protein
MSAWWVLPPLALAVGASCVWWVGRRAQVELLALRSELDAWSDARHELGRLRADTLEMGARYRQLRRR